MIDTLPVAEARALVEGGFLTCRVHPLAPELLIWNYTAKTQYGKAWSELTMACRGLITDSAGTIIARPFPKFFNLEEHVAAGREIPTEPFDVFEKLDGSLGILYRAPDGYAIATRGAFASQQAIEGTRMLRSIGLDWQTDRYTFLFEIIYPENRIVVNYGTRRELVLLAIVETATGSELDPHTSAYVPTAKRYDVDSLDAIRAVVEAGSEGAVIRFRNSGLRLKVKLEEYVRLHRLVTGVTPRRVWEVLSRGESLESMLEAAPEEFSTWLRSVAEQLAGEYSTIERQCARDFADVPVDVPRNQQAAVIKQRDYPAVLFRMLDGKSYADLIWKEIYPPAAVAFRSQDESVA